MSGIGPIETLDILLERALQQLQDRDDGLLVTLVQASELVDSLRRSNLTGMLDAIEELKKAHEDVTRFYES